MNGIPSQVVFNKLQNNALIYISRINDIGMYAQGASPVWENDIFLR